MKICNKCEIEQEESCFCRDKTKKDGLHAICKNCKHKRAREYYRSDEGKRYNKEYEEGHREEIKQRHRKYREENKEELRVKRQIKAAEPEEKEKTNVRRREYVEKNKEKVTEYTNEYNKIYRKQKADKIKNLCALYRKQHKNELKIKNSIYLKNKCEKDPEFKAQLGSRKYVSFVLSPEILKRDKYKCTLCESNKKLVAHHIIPVKQAPELIECRSNLITVCKECHLAKCHNGNTKTINKEIATILQEIVNLRESDELSVVTC